MASHAPRRSEPARISRLRQPNAVPARLRSSEQQQPAEPGSKCSPSRLPLPTNTLPSRRFHPPGQLHFLQSAPVTRFETTFTVKSEEAPGMSEADEEPAPAGIDRNLAMVPGVALDGGESRSPAPGVEGKFLNKGADVDVSAAKDTTFVVAVDDESKTSDVPDVVYSATPDVVPLHCETDVATDVKEDEIPPNSPGASSLGASLKFLEGSHLLTYDEMVDMGCQPKTDNQVNVDASGCSSLLTESLLNMSLPERPAAPSPLEECRGDSGIASARSVARPASVHSDVTSSVDTGYHGGESEAASSPIGSVDSNLTRSKGSTEVPNGINLADVVPEVAKMETVDELAERSVSEADLTMREEEADASSEATPSLVSLTVAPKKKRTRSPTLASAKGESVPAKRSLTQQRQAGASGSRLSSTSTPGARRSTSNLKTASNTSISGQTAPARPNTATRKSTQASGSGSLSSSSSGPASSRRLSASNSATKTSNGPSAPAPGKSAGVGTRPRKSISGSAANGEAKKNGRENVDGGGQSTPRRGSTSARSNMEASGGGASSSANGGASRLKAPSMLNRTFSRKSGAVSSSGNSAPLTPRSSTLRSSVSSSSSGATIPGPSASAASARRRDSQLQRQPSLPKNARGPVASSTPHVERSNASTPTSAVTNNKSRPMAVTAPGDAKSQNDSPRKSSIALDRKSSVTLDRRSSVNLDRKPSVASERKASTTLDRRSSIAMDRKPSVSMDSKAAPGRSTPLIELREQLATQTTQINAQNEQLATQTAQITAQSEQLAAQAEKIASQDSRISELKVESESKTEEIVRTRSQLREAVYSFDIMAIVCQNLDTQWKGACQQIEVLSTDLMTAHESYQIMDVELNAVMSENQLMAETISSAENRHEEDMEELNAQHRVAMKAEKLKFKEEKEEALEKLVEQQSAEVKTLKRYHEKELERLRVHYETVMQELKRKHHSDLEEISQRDERHLQELQHQHEKKVAEITHRFEEMKVVLTERVQSLSVEGSDLKSKANQFEENIRRNSDVKLQAPQHDRHFGFMSLSASSSCLNDASINGRFGLASSEAVIHQFQHLPEENASLKAVLDLRINENADLRRQNTELQEKLGQLDEAKDRREQLLRQIENLEAIISLKTDNEKQLHDKHQQLLRRYERESKEKKRLSMNYEELLYKLEERQSTEDLTKSSLSDLTSMTSSAVIVRPRTQTVASRQRHRGLQHDRSKRRTIASSRELDP